MKVRYTGRSDTSEDLRHEKVILLRKKHPMKLGCYMHYGPIIKLIEAEN